MFEGNWHRSHLLCGANIIYKTNWIRIQDQFYEHKHYKTYNITIEHNDKSLAPRWGTIDQQCHKLVGCHDPILAMPKSGMGENTQVIFLTIFNSCDIFANYVRFANCGIELFFFFRWLKL